MLPSQCFPRPLNHHEKGRKKERAAPKNKVDTKRKGIKIMKIYTVFGIAVVVVIMV